MENIILVHHGTKGMRWGIRRYQNKDGSLTPAGKKRYDKEMAKLTAEKKKLRNQERTKAKLAKLKATQDEVNAKKKSLLEDADETSPKKRTIKDMSDSELREKINRLELERRYSDLTKNSSDKKKIFDGKQFVTNVLSRSGEELLTQTAKHFGAKALNKIIGEEVIYANNKKK